MKEKYFQELKTEKPHSVNLPFNEPIKLSLSQIRRDGGTQSRAAIHQTTVDEYAEDYKNGANFPPITVFYDGEILWLADGFHREKAALKAGLTEIAAIVKQGTRRDAVLYSVGANAKHGLRRSNADKRRAVMTLLEDGEWSQLSNNAIAKKCGVSLDLVNRLRRSLNESLSENQNSLTNSLNDSDSQTRTYTTKHGTQAKMNTANIGKRKSSEPLPPSAEDKEVINKTEDKVVNTPSEDKEGISPTSKKEINHPSNTQPDKATTDNTTTDNAPPDNEPPNIRKLLSEGDRVRIKDNHHKFGGQFGIVTFIPNRECAVVEFSPGFRKVIQLEDFDFSPRKKEIIIQEGLNYFAGSPCKWYVEVEEKTYLRLQEYREKVGTITLDAAIARFLEEEKEKTPNSDDLVLYFLANVKQLPRERVNVVLSAFAKAHYEAFVQVFNAIKH